MYPDTAANIPAIKSKEWFQGRNVQPIMMSMVNGETKLKVVDSENVKYNRKDTQQLPQQPHQPQQQQPPLHQTPISVERKITIESNYAYNIKSNLNGFNKLKENDNKINKSCDNNNSKKFAFLAQQTIPDYRPQQVTLCIHCSLLN